jgi:hypothetical protein
MPYPLTPQTQIGINWYPSGQNVPDEQAIHLIPYTLGLRAPYLNAASDSWQGGYNQGYASGTYDASIRAGAAGIVVGAAAAWFLSWAFKRK